MSEIELPLSPRVFEDPYAAGVVQENLQYLASLFQRGTEEGDTLAWNVERSRYLVRPQGGAELVTALPTTDLYGGLTVMFTDSIVSPTYFWLLRYTPEISDDYKWVAIGPQPLFDYTDNSYGTSSTTFVDLESGQPQVTLPLKGFYEVDFGGSMGNSTADSDTFIGPHYGSTPTDADSMRMEGVVSSGGSSNTISQARATIIEVTSANQVLKHQYKVASGTGTFLKRWIKAKPIRLSA